VAAALAAVAGAGRAAFYQGPFGEGLIAPRRQASTPPTIWPAPGRVGRAAGAAGWDHDVFVPPPPSQAYLVLAGVAVAAGLDLPADPGDGAWAHLLAESARAVGLDRNDVLYDGADGAALLSPDRIAAARAAVDPGAGAPASRRWRPEGPRCAARWTPTAPGSP
jgi:gamma-glutamyltranspeptidase/glutathione hydrolase